MKRPKFIDQVDEYPFEPADDRLFEGTYSVVEVNAKLWTFESWKPTTTNFTRITAELLNWFRLRPHVTALHEPVGGNMYVVKDFDRSSLTSSINDLHRFYFNDPEHARLFRDDLPKMLAAEDMLLFLPFSEIATDDSESAKLAGMINYDFDTDFSKLAIETWFWCLDNLVGSVYRDRERLIFTNDEDIVLFKLALTGDEQASIPRLKLY